MFCSLCHDLWNTIVLCFKQVTEVLARFSFHFLRTPQGLQFSLRKQLPLNMLYVNAAVRWLILTEYYAI